MIDDGRIKLPEASVLVGIHDTYIVGSVRGLGGSSIVYDGIRSSDEIPVLIKELYPSDKNIAITRNGYMVEIAEDEAATSMAISSREIFDACKKNAYGEKILLTKFATKYYAYNELDIDFFEQNNTIYTVFHNKDNSCVLSDEPKQNFTTYLRYIKMILEALKPLHDLGYLHLDLSPDNIYKTKMGRDEPILRLIDFNSTVHIDHIKDIKYLSSKHGFSAYELTSQKKDKIGYASDIYSVTACLFFWLFERVPNALDSSNLSINKDLSAAFQDKSEFVVVECCRILTKGLQADSRKRYQSAEEMLNEINGLIKKCELPEYNDSEILIDMDKRISQASNKLEHLEKSIPVYKRRITSNKMKKVFAVILLLVLIASVPLTVRLISKMPRTIKNDDGSIYVGQIKNGIPNGQGQITYINGDIYVGEWRNNKKEGTGRYESSIYIYDGSYVNDKKEGFGKIIYKNVIFSSSNLDVSSYEGDWANDQYHGKGNLYLGNGDFYNGDFAVGMYHGTGSYNSYAGAFDYSYSGEWVNGDFVFGLLLYTDPDWGYYGPFQNFMLTGKGVLRLIGGTQINGNFSNFKLNGEATISLKDGAIAICEFRNNCPIEDIEFFKSTGELVKIITVEEATISLENIK